jgi:hypothetical protein
MTLKQKIKMDFGKPTEIEALILANQALILQALEMLIDKPQVSSFLNKAILNIHDILKRHHEDGK